MSIPLPQPKWGTFKEDFIEFRISQGQLRARDLEVAKLVLEAAAKACEEQRDRSKAAYDKAKRDRDLQIYHHAATTAKWCADAIRALEFRHE